jgi:hypothetical protein
VTSASGKEICSKVSNARHQHYTALRFANEIFFLFSSEIINITFFYYVYLAWKTIEFWGLSGMQNKLRCLPRTII